MKPDAMNVTPVCVPEWGDSASVPPVTIKIVILYDDDASRQRALCGEKRLVSLLGPACDLQFVWWRFNSLRHPETVRRASNAAEEAQVIIFSVHASEDLPKVVKDWLEQ